MKKLLLISIHLLGLGVLFWFWGCSPAKSDEKAKQRLPLVATHFQNSDFEKDFVAFFKVLSLPYQSEDSLAMNDTIPAKWVIRYILEATEKAEMHHFDELWGNDEIKAITQKGLEDRFINIEKNVFAVLNFSYVGRLALHENFYSLIFAYVPTFMEGSYQYIYLANFKKDGTFLDALQIGGSAGYVDLISEWKSEISKEGKIQITQKTTKKGGMEDGSADFTELAYLTFQTEESGKFKLEKEKYTGFSGNFQAQSSQEVIKLDEFAQELVIIYRKNPSAEGEEVWEVLNFDKQKRVITAKNSQEKEIIIAFDKDKKGFSCKKSDGSTITFSRQRN